MEEWTSEIDVLDGGGTWLHAAASRWLFPARLSCTIVALPVHINLLSHHCQHMELNSLWHSVDALSCAIDQYSGCRATPRTDESGDEASAEAVASCMSQILRHHEVLRASGMVGVHAAAQLYYCSTDACDPNKPDCCAGLYQDLLAHQQSLFQSLMPQLQVLHAGCLGVCAACRGLFQGNYILWPFHRPALRNCRVSWTETPSQLSLSTAGSSPPLHRPRRLSPMLVSCATPPLRRRATRCLTHH